MTTKEKIIYEALSLFSVRGYEAVSVRDISKNVGIKESSLYNHFKNKQDIFDTIIQVCNEKSTQLFTNLNLQQTFEGNIEIYKSITPEFLLQLVTRTFEFYVSDDYMLKFRRLLTIEQFNNEAISKLYIDIFIDQAIEFQTILFSTLMKEGLMIKADPKSVALEFYAPVFLILCRYDKLTDEVKEILKNHIVNFTNKNIKQQKP
jgi:AcrR family transcriptional regulator